MSINADKPHLWKADTCASVDQFNRWFMKFAPEAYRRTRERTVEGVEAGLNISQGLSALTPGLLKSNPEILPMLRMSTCPPLARDRLVGLSGCGKNLVGCLEEGKLPPHMAPKALDAELKKITRILRLMLDGEIFPWLAEGRPPKRQERYRAATIVADRLCGSLADPIVRNAQEQRQLTLLRKYLEARGYRLQVPSSGQHLNQMTPGTFSFRFNVQAKSSGSEERMVKIPIDAVVQPKSAKPPHLPIFIEAKSAGDFTNVNKRRKEEATKMTQLKATYGQVVFVLFLCGYFDAAYLGYEAAEGIDWVWEHRPQDLDKLGI